MPAPLSVDEIFAKQKAEKEAASKVSPLPVLLYTCSRPQPKFLSKAERAKLALAKREAEVKEQQSKEVEVLKQHDQFARAAEDERRKADSSRCEWYPARTYTTRMTSADIADARGDYRDRERDHDRGRDFRERDGLDYRERDGRGGRGGRRDEVGRGGRGKNNNKPAPAAPETDLDVIKKRYLGQQETVKKPFLRKSNNKNVVFDWNAGDDTSAQALWVPESDSNGAGAGGQRQGGSAAASHTGSPAPGSEKFTDALERRRAGKGSNDDRHWSDKPLPDMKERDWRIFREDYSISSRGGNIPYPLRSWRESDIPLPVLDIIDKIGYTEPSPIQRQAIPIGLQNRDLVGIAKTGT
jgi:ATP-dependent RNA helicase DDX23/PRP28